jgi:hypothetical protein
MAHGLIPQQPLAAFDSHAKCDSPPKIFEYGFNGPLTLRGEYYHM